METVGALGRLGSSALALLLVACGSGRPGQADPAASSDAPSASASALPSATSSEGEPITSPSNGGDGSNDPSSWRSIAIPPEPATGSPVALTEGFDGGLLALTQQVDMRPGDYEGESGSKLVVWHVTSDGRLDPAFAGDGSVTYTSGHAYKQFDVGGFERRPSDGSLILLSSVADSGSDQYTTAYRITRDGTLDDAYHRRHEPVLDRPDEEQYRMTTLGDDSVRYCTTSHDTVTLWGLTSTGDEDDRLGPEGRRDQVIQHARCGDADTNPDGQLVIGFMRLTRIVRCSADIETQIELARVDASSNVDTAWGGEPFPAVPIQSADTYRVYGVQRMATVADGSTYVAGVTGTVNDCGHAQGDWHGFIMRADPDGHWDRGFGDDGLARFDGSYAVGLASSGSRLVVASNDQTGQGRTYNIDGVVQTFDAATGEPIGAARRFPDSRVVGPVIQGSTVAVFAQGAIERFPLEP